ncbi:MAG: hypothetical protein M3487_04160 [Actinomycetota bacterium]|nr:hypothetical protein [Actinomycetota bacterium]
MGSVPAVLGILDLSTGYQIMGLLHVITVVAAFGPLLVYPTLQRAGDSAAVAKLHLRLVLPALVLVWVLGMGMVGMSDNVIEMTQTWIVLSLVGWVALMLVSWFLVRPAITDSGAAARSRLAAGVGVTHLLLVVIIALMIFKPGF